MLRSTESRRGFTLIELLVVIAIIGLLIALLLPAVQQSRESSRQAECKNKLSQLGKAAQEYESAHKRLPPGYLGPFFNDPNYSSPFGGQCVGGLVYLLPYLEQGPIFDQIDPRVYLNVRKGAPPHWWTDPVLWGLAQQNLPVLLCPSDNPYESAIGTIVILHTWFDSVTPQAVLDGYVFSNTGGGEGLGRTNYIGVAGGMGRIFNPPWDFWQGMLTNRSETRFAEARDGQSSTLLFGEALGGLTGPKQGPITRDFSYSWFGCGTLPTAWSLGAVDPTTENGGEWYRFSSYHPGIVQFCFADGSVRNISVSIDDGPGKRYFRASSGMHDEVPVPGDAF